MLVSLAEGSHGCYQLGCLENLGNYQRVRCFNLWGFRINGTSRKIRNSGHRRSSFTQWSDEAGQYKELKIRGQTLKEHMFLPVSISP